ncbi:MAG: hypothetical protein RI885_2065 [Actinomycetota bacterium]
MATLTSIDDVLDVIRQAAAPGRRVVVGITGPPGVGKSTVAELVVGLLGTDRPPGGTPELPAPGKTPELPAPDETPKASAPALAALLPMDGFHLPQARLTELGRRDRMGAPDTFDVDGFVSALGRLRADDGEVLAPGFEREVEEATPDSVVLPAAARIIVVEGNYLLLETGGWSAVRELLDLSLFVTLGRGIRQSRLIERHRRFGKTAEAASAWTLGPDEANARLIEATAVHADHVVALG